MPDFIDLISGGKPSKQARVVALLRAMLDLLEEEEGDEGMGIGGKPKLEGPLVERNGRLELLTRPPVLPSPS